VQFFVYADGNGLGAESVEKAEEKKAVGVGKNPKPNETSQARTPVASSSRPLQSSAKAAPVQKTIAKKPDQKAGKGGAANNSASNQKSLAKTPVQNAQKIMPVQKAQPGKAGVINKQTAKAKAPAGPPPKTALPPNWEEHMSEEHGVPYFWNRVTKESRWIKPTK